MDNENRIDENISAAVDTGSDLAEVLQSYKQNSVSKEEYDKLRQENKNLMEAMMNTTVVEAPVQVEEEVDLQQLRNEIFNKESSNLKFIENSLKLRNELLKRGEPDPFTPYGRNISATDEDLNTANKVATVLQECVDYAQGDNQIFTTELQRRMIDIAPIRR